MRRSGAIAAGLVLGVGLLSGCGGDDGDAKSSGGDYCDTLKASAAAVKSFTGEGATPDFAKFDEFIDAARVLEDSAPSELADDWKVVVDGMDQITTALADAGITLEQLMTAVTTGQMPEGVDQAKLVALAPKLQSLGGGQIEAATKTIGQHAKDECGVELAATN